MTLNREHCTPNEPGPSKIIDAEGREIPHVIRANTVTGEVVQLDVNAFGMTRPDNDGEQCARVTRRYPAPLAFIPLLLALCFNVFAETTAERLDDGIPAASSAITPTKGSLWVANGTAFIPLAVGTNAQILQADSTATNGIKWAAAGGVDTTANFTWTGTHTFDLVQIWKQSATPSTPAANYYKLYFKSDGKLYKINSAGTEAEVGAGGVTSVATGNGLSGGPITGAGTIDLRLDVNGTLSKTLGAGSNEVGIASGGVGTTQLAASGVTYAKLQDVAGLSVVGRSANTSGVSAAITASATGQVLRYAGTTLTFGALDLTDSDAVSGILPSTYGGTGNGFTKFSGPAGTEKTLTLPNASAAVLTDNAAVTVAQGGTGVATLTAYAPIFGGTTATGAVQSGAVGTAGDVLTSNGAGAIATFQTPSSTATNATNTAITNDTTTNATMYPTWVTANTGNLPQKVSSTKFTANPSTGNFTATTFTGALSGNATTATSATALVDTDVKWVRSTANTWDLTDNGTSKAVQFTTGGLMKGVAGSSVNLSLKAIATNVCTLTTASAHNLTPGSTILLAGVDGNLNGTWNVVSTPSTTTLTFNCGYADVASAAATGTLTQQATAKIGNLVTSSSINHDELSNVDVQIANASTSRTPLAIYGLSGTTAAYFNIYTTSATPVWSFSTASSINYLTSGSHLILKGQTAQLRMHDSGQFRVNGPFAWIATGGDPAGATQPDVGIERTTTNTFKLTAGNPYGSSGPDTSDELRIHSGGRIYGNAVTAPTFSSGSVTSNVATITTTAAHNLCVGQPITISASATTIVDGDAYVKAVSSSTVFTFDFTVANGTITAATITPRGQVQLGAQAAKADGLAEVLLAASATTKKGLVVQGKASQTANLTEWQSSTGAVQASVSPAGVFTGDGSGLTNLGGVTTILKAYQTADVNITNSAVETDLTGMSVTVAASTVYSFHALVMTTYTNGGGVGVTPKLQLTGTATLNGAQLNVKRISGNGLATVNQAPLTALNSESDEGGVSGVPYNFEIDGTIDVNGAGTIKIQGTQTAASLDTRTFLKYNNMLLVKQ